MTETNFSIRNATPSDASAIAKLLTEPGYSTNADDVPAIFSRHDAPSPAPNAHRAEIRPAAA